MENLRFNSLVQIKRNKEAIISFIILSLNKQINTPLKASRKPLLYTSNIIVPLGPTKIRGIATSVLVIK